MQLVTYPVYYTDLLNNDDLCPIILLGIRKWHVTFMYIVHINKYIV